MSEIANETRQAWLLRGEIAVIVVYNGSELMGTAKI